MSYDKTIWSSGDIISREKLQKIENQLEFLSDATVQGAVSYSEEQNLTPAQLAQVYDNIDIADTVRYDHAQSLTESQKEQVKANLDITDYIELWSENGAYQTGDYILYKDKIYRSLTGVTGIDPSEDTTNWILINKTIEVTAHNSFQKGLKIGDVAVNDQQVDFLIDRESALGLVLEKQKTLAPVYRGDYICEGHYLPSCCLRIGNYYYTLDAIEEPDLPTPADPVDADQRNYGLVHKFDIQANQEVISTAGENDATETWPKVAKIGHANSIAYDSVNQIIYVAPLFDYSTYTTTPGETEGETTITYGRADSKVLYKFDTNFDFLDTEEVGYDPYWTTQLVTPCAVSYDSVANELYCLYRPDSSTYKARIFKKNSNGTWNFFRYLPVMYANNDRHVSFNQDFAVYNNYWFRNHTSGYIIWGTLDLESGSNVDAHVIGAYNYAGTDSLNKYYLGELEGMEFDSSGHLYAMCLLDFFSKSKNAFVTELPIGFQKVDAPSYSSSDLGIVQSVTLSPATQTEFAQSLTHIKGLNQLLARVAIDCISEVKIVDDVVDDREIRIDSRFRLTLKDGTYKCKLIKIEGGVLNIANTNTTGSASHPILSFTTGTSDLITLSKTGELLITGTNMLYIGHPNNNNSRTLIKIGTDFNKVTIRLNPYNCEETGSNKNNFRISGVDLASDSFFMGTMLVASRGTPWNQYKTNTYINSADCNISSYIHSTSLVTAIIDFTVAADTISQNTSVHFFEIHWRLRRAVSTQIIGSNGTIARLDMDTSGRLNITPLNQACSNERFCTTLALPQS